MSNNNNNMLFLRLAQGGQLTPEMMQMMQQSGQLPQMDMGAGLNDIQRMNMKQQSHYGNSMFRYGGVPMAAGGEQEQTDQQFLSPDKKYSGRVQDFLKQLKSKAMNVVQDEMLGTANDYDQEAMAIDMQNQMRYGGVYAPGGATFGQQPTFDMSGVNAANAWLKAGQENQVDMTQNVANVATAATGLKGFFNNSGADKFNDNINNSSYIKKGFITDLATGDRDRIRMAPGGQPDVDLPKYFSTPEEWAENAKLEANAKKMGWVNADGTADVAGYSAVGADGKQYGYGPQYKPNLATSTKKKKDVSSNTAPKLTPEQEAAAKVKADQEARVAEQVKKAEEEKKKKEEGDKTGTKTDDKTGTKPEDKKEDTKTDTKTTDVGDGMDYWRMLADPNSTQAGGMYQLDKNGNPVPQAFYDPNMRIANMSADYRVPLSNMFRKRENRKTGVMKRAQFDFTYSPQSQNPVAPQNPAATPSNAPAPAGKPTWANQFFPQQKEKLEGPGYAGGPYSVELQGGLSDAEGFSRSPEADAGYQQQIEDWRPGMLKPGIPKGLGYNIGPNNFTAPAASSATQGMMPSSIAQGPGAQNVIPFAPADMSQVPATVPLPQAPLSGRQQVQQIRQTGKDQRALMMQQAKEQIQKMYDDARNQQGGGASQQAYSPEGLGSNPPGTLIQGNDGNFYFQDANGQVHSSNNQNSLTQKRDGLGLTGKAYGGGLRRFVSGGVDPTIGMDKPWVPETVTKHMDYRYGKDNAFLVPGMMAGLDLIGAGLRNKEAGDMTAKAMDKFSSDQIYTTMPQKSGARGDYDDKGNFRPDEMNPSPQFSGYNFQSNYAAEGGEMSEGDEMYLDEDTINAILAAGGQIEYLD